MVVNIHYMIPDVCDSLVVPDITLCAPLFVIYNCLADLNFYR